MYITKSQAENLIAHTSSDGCFRYLQKKVAKNYVSFTCCRKAKSRCSGFLKLKPKIDCIKRSTIKAKDRLKAVYQDFSSD